MHDTSASTQRMIGEFQNYYSKKAVSRGEPDPPVKEIPEIVITPPGTNPPINDPLPNTGGGGTYTPPYTGDMSGGPIMHGGGTGTSTTQDPCKKTKNLLASQKIKTITEDLKNHIAKGANAGEKGWKDNKVGDPTQTTQNSDHSVNFGDPSTINGGYHTHQGTGVKIFSATDIVTLIEIARYQNVGNAGNGYMGVLAPGGIHYVMYFNGNHVDLPVSGSYSEDQLKNLNDEQWTDYLESISSNSLSSNQKLEKIFFLTLDKLGLKNKIILQKIGDNNISTVNQNSDGVAALIPCNN